MRLVGVLILTFAGTIVSLNVWTRLRLRTMTRRRLQGEFNDLVEEFYLSSPGKPWVPSRETAQ